MAKKALSATALLQTDEHGSTIVVCPVCVNETYVHPWAGARAGTAPRPAGDLEKIDVEFYCESGHAFRLGFFHSKGRTSADLEQIPIDPSMTWRPAWSTPKSRQ